MLCSVLAPLYSYASLKSPLLSCFGVLRNVHFAVHLFSNRSQMKSLCGKNRKTYTLGAGECVTDVPKAVWRLL